jgi:transglutaminase-like putative cysteine protease
VSARPKLTFVAALATLFAALSLSAAFDDGSWFWPVVATTAAAALGCALGRRIGLPRLVVPLLGLAAVIVVVTWLDARDVAVFGLFPGPGALRALDELAREGFEGIRRYTTPAPTDPGLVMLAAFGVGAVAVIVDTLAVGYRSAALAGAPLLILYAVPLTVVRGGVPIILFLFAAVGWLALMLAEGRERLAGWGRALGRRSQKEDDPLTYTPPEPLGVVGRRIGAAAMGLAIVVPVLMPWAGSSLFKGSGGGTGPGGGGSGGQVNRLSPTVQLGGWLTQKTEVTLLKYTSTDTNPEYFRVVTLDSFDGKQWVQAKQVPAGNAEDSLPDPSSGLGGSEVQTQIDDVALNQTWLPVPYPGGAISGLTGGWSYDENTLDVFSNGRASTSGQHYSVISHRVDPTAAQLRATQPPPLEQLQQYLKLPDNIPGLVRDTEQRIVADKPTEYDKALALQQFFVDPKNGFTYTTTPTIPGNPLVGFLTKRQGFCQQYAGTYAVMARLAGLPTRIEVGFSPGSEPDRQNRRTITNKNAHAWPEVYFAGYGWIRFEPTAGTVPLGIRQPDYAPAPGQAGQGPQAQGEHSGPNTKLQQDLSNPNNNDTTPVNPPNLKTASATQEPASFPWALTIALVALVLLLMPAAARFVRRRRRLTPVPSGTPPDQARERVRVAWLEVAETAIDLHDVWPAARTPRRTADWVAGLGLPADASAAGYRLARAVERSRYAPAGVDVLAGTDPAADARAVCRALEAGASRRERWRARFIPVSVLARLSEASADVLDWLDDAGARLRSRLRRMVGRRHVATDA